jgi:hypothetical protein
MRNRDERPLPGRARLGCDRCRRGASRDRTGDDPDRGRPERALGLEGPFDLVLDIGCFHGIGRARRDAYVAGVAARTRPGAALFLYAFSMRGVIPVGVSPSEIAHRFAPAFEPVGRILGREPPGSAYYRLVRTDRP